MIPPTQFTRIGVLKFGGAIAENPQARAEALRGVAAYAHPCIVVHGGGSLASELSEQMGYTPQMHNGRRITDEPTLRIVTMVYAGLVNTTFVAELQALGCRAVGMRGCDDDIIRSKKRSPEPIDFGFVGDIVHVRGDILMQHLRRGILPVIAPITHDGNGQLLNTNADTIAAHVAQSLATECGPQCIVEVVYCFGHNGVLRNIEQPDSVIESMTVSQLDEFLASGAAAGGMIAKLENARALACKGVDVRICSYKDFSGGTCIIGERA
ncbi:MAG: acetylglutamate kinase [Candidatus Kapaibacterium sp.]